MKSGKMLAVVIAAVLIMSCVSACSSGGEISNPALVSKVTQYDIDYTTGEWREKLVTEYEYENAYPTLIKSYDNDSKSEDSKIFKYEFNEEKPVKMEQYDEKKHLESSAKYTKRGNISRRCDYYGDGDEWGGLEQLFIYGNRGRYFTTVLHENLMRNPDDPDTPDDHAEEVDTVDVEVEDGLLRKTINNGIFANFTDGAPKEWCRFDGTYTAYYDDNGIVNVCNAQFSSYPGSGDQVKFDVVIKDGRITDVIRSESGSDGNWTETNRFAFEYSDVGVDNARYASMINEIIMMGSNNYYMYNWY